VKKNNKSIVNQFENLLNSNNISKFQDIVNLLDDGLGNIIYKEIKKSKHDILNKLRGHAGILPRETMYIFNNIYQYLLKKESKKRLNFAVLYFWIGDIFYQLNQSGYGEFYLKSYLEDLSYHTNPETGGSAHSLRARCFLGESGLNLIKEETKKLINAKNDKELVRSLKKLDRIKFESLAIELSASISLEGNEKFFIPSSTINGLIIKIKRYLKSKKKDPKQLELLSQVLFGSVNGFSYNLDQRSRLLQIDGIIINNSDNKSLIQLGNYIIVEAKQYFYSKIDRKIIDIISINIERLNATSAFLLSTGKLTNEAEEEIYHYYLRHGKFIIFLSLKDIKSLCENSFSFPILISKKIQDIGMKRKIK